MLVSRFLPWVSGIVQHRQTSLTCLPHCHHLDSSLEGNLHGDDADIVDVEQDGLAAELLGRRLETRQLGLGIVQASASHNSSH